MRALISIFTNAIKLRGGVWTVPQLVFVTVGQLAALLAMTAWVAPAFWQRQLDAGWVSTLAWFGGINLLHALCEWAIHRYALHLVVVPLAASGATAHRLHHQLTWVRVLGGQLANRFPITQPSQTKAATFPWYTFWIWFGLFTPLYAGLQWVGPEAPVVLAGWLAMTWGHCLYEVWHAVEHLDYERYWGQWVRWPVVGRWVAAVYSFHLMHHANPNCNLAIGGFFGLPIADWVLGTYLPVVRLPGQAIESRELTAPRPRFALIRWFDAQARALDRQYTLRHRRSDTV